tara:strand:+ start:708 stop:2384 length:1677 start_codon:yes stop_codon:yes gene_type:complete
MAQSLKTLIGKEGTGGTAVIDNREFKNWQDFYGCLQYGPETEIPNSSRDAGNSTGGTGTGDQPRKVGYGTTKNWVVPTGVSKIRITVLGGGGGGAAKKGSHYYGGGGGQGAPFISGEFNVTGGETLNIQVGRGGQGKDGNGGGDSGSQTEVVAASGSGGTAFINIASQGGYGGETAASDPPAPAVGTLSGSALRSNNQINNKGGQGGRGDNNSIGWGPEGYGGGGGGSAGSYKGDGYEGGSAQSVYGYSFCGAGGGGIGGKGGNAGGSQTSNQYHSQGGGGGGSRGAGGNGDNNSSGAENKGGTGFSDQHNVQGYTDDLPQTEASRTTSYREGWPATDSSDWASGSKQWWTKMKGTRYGDGYSEAPIGLRIGVSSGGAGGTYEAVFSAGGGGGTMVTTLEAKTFNGILGRCTGSGGAGSNASNPVHGGISVRGGEGGSGAGGGGASNTTSQDQTSNTDNWYEWNDFDVANMAFTAYGKGSHLGSSSYDKRDLLHDNWGKFQPMGGNGGALGGGGAGGNRSFGGLGGIGGGGGGACNNFNQSYGCRGGHGGPGYVLIEW